MFAVDCLNTGFKIEVSKPKIMLKLQNGQVLVGNRKILKQSEKSQPSTNGSNVVMKDKIVYEFLGVPYAKVPLNERRFEFPHKLDRTLPENVYNATYYRPSCMQEYDTTFSGFSGSEMWNPPHGVNEDCLYMNMWIPVTQEQDDVLYRQEVLNKLEDTNKINFIKTAFKSTSSSSNSNNMKPSLFWVYGGSFNSGSSNLRINEGTIISALENVIILTSNYRTGPFGFLYLNSTRAPGNMGVADQIMAIEWYKENYLTYFGGSYNDMCLFGESAGAMSLHLLLLSNKNHIFNRAIFQSSSSYLDTSYRSKYDAYKLSLSFAEKVGCIKTSSSASAPNSNNSTNFSQLFKQSSNALKIKFNKNYSNKYNHYSDYYFNELNDDDIVNCLMKLNSSYLSLKQFDLDYVNEYLKMQFLPIADYNFNNLKIDDPFDEFIFNINNNFKKYTHDILVGINQNEGTYFTFYLYNNKYFDLNGFYKYYSQQQQQP